MTFFLEENRFRWSPTERRRIEEVRHYGSRVFHQVNRGNVGNKHYPTKSREVCLGKYYLPLWGS